VAERVLAEWDALRGAWVKVFPRDYKRVLEEAAERTGLAQDGAMAAAVAGGIEEQAIPAQG
jgi:glutamate synthase domain-containing protein 3